jgi:hypothetical protein
VILIKLQSDEDSVLGFVASAGDRDLLRVETSRQHGEVRDDRTRRQGARAAAAPPVHARHPNEVENPPPLGE